MDKVGHTTLERMNQAKHYNTWLFAFIRPYIKEPILEVGCGIGTFTKEFVNFGETYAIDIQKLYIKQTKKHVTKAKVGVGDIEKGKYFFAPMGGRSARNKKFNTIVNLNVLEHIKDDEKALKNMYKLIQPKGKLVLLTPAHSFAYTNVDKNLGHYRRYTKKSLSDKFQKAGFNVIDVKYLNWFGLLGWFVTGKILRAKIIPSSNLRLFNILSRPLLFIEKFIHPPFGLSVFIVGQKQ